MANRIYALKKGRRVVEVSRSSSALWDLAFELSGGAQATGRYRSPSDIRLLKGRGWGVTRSFLVQVPRG